MEVETHRGYWGHRGEGREGSEGIKVISSWYLLIGQNGCLTPQSRLQTLWETVTPGGLRGSFTQEVRPAWLVRGDSIGGRGDSRLREQSGRGAAENPLGEL